MLARWTFALALLATCGPACVTVRGGEAPLKMEKSHLFVEARIDGQGPFEFALDTGAEGTIISAEVASKLQLSGYRQATVIAIGGSRLASTGTVHNVEVGTASMSALPVLIGGSHGASNVDGILGVSFFRKFRVTIDYASMLATFTP